MAHNFDWKVYEIPFFVVVVVDVVLLREGVCGDETKVMGRVGDLSVSVIIMYKNVLESRTLNPPPPHLKPKTYNRVNKTNVCYKHVKMYKASTFPPWVVYPQILPGQN